MGPLGGPQGVAVRGARVLVEPGNRKDHVLQALVDIEGLIRRPVPGTAGAVEGHGDCAPHAQVLAALAREQEGDAAFVLSDSVGAAIRVLKGCFRGRIDGGCQALQLVLQLAFRSGHNPKASPGVGIKALGALPGDALQHSCRQVLGGQRTGLLGEGCAVGTGKGHQLEGHGAQARGRGAGSRVLLQGDVEIGTTKAKGADAGPARMLAVADPGAHLGVDMEGRVFQVQLGVGLLDLDGGGQHLVVQGHDGLEQACSACCCLGVADLGLHRAQRAPLLVLLGLRIEDDGQATELRCIPGRRAGAVGLDHLDGLGAVARDLIGSGDRLGLPFGNGCINALGAAIGAGAHTGDHRVDPVSIALGIVEALEGHHADTLAKHCAVRLVREGPAVSAGAQGRGLAEAHEHEDVVQRVDAAGDHQVRVAHVQLVDRHAQRGERGGAGCIGDAVGAAQVQAVGDAASHDVSKETREAAFLPGHVVI